MNARSIIEAESPLKSFKAVQASPEAVRQALGASGWTAYNGGWCKSKTVEPYWDWDSAKRTVWSVWFDRHTSKWCLKQEEQKQRLQRGPWSDLEQKWLSEFSTVPELLADLRARYLLTKA